ncbi:Xylose isomerase [Zea mays]|uniref:Xylose isomerase n=1 Tax=Zea mays TaxID=4577 RepID=A0A3L6GAV9_MAIZE|nr:Xylose isomerase [Zea mays]
MPAFVPRLPLPHPALKCSMTFTEKMVLAVFRDLIILWMTKSLMDDIHGLGVLFNGRVGDRTITGGNWKPFESNTIPPPLTLEPKPNKGHLAWADAFVITADSISMLSEACSTRRRESTNVEDMFLAHIFEMDTLARGLHNVVKLIEDGKADFEMLKRKVLE